MTTTTNLDDLLTAILSGDLHEDAYDCWTSLPTYGGEDIDDTDCVWSWDADRALIGTCVADMRIVTRAELADMRAHGDRI